MKYDLLTPVINSKLGVKLLFGLILTEHIFYMAKTSTTKKDSVCQKLIGIEESSADFVLGGLFPAHYYDSGRQRYQFNFQASAWVEAMLYTIREINQNVNIIPNHTLGYRIFDTCDTEALATEATLHFVLEHNEKNEGTVIKREAKDGCCLRNRNGIIAVVGDASSAVASSVATLLSVDKIPEIGYSATSPTLGDKTIYPSFLRTIPSDHFQASLLVDLLYHFNWTYIAVLASDDEYGRAGANYLLPKLKDAGVCLSQYSIFSPTVNDREITKIVDGLKSDTRSRVAILWCQRPSAYAILKAAERKALYDIVWIGTETWSNYEKILEFHPRVVSGLLGIAPYVSDLNSFNKYLDKKELCQQHKNIWLSMIVRDHLKVNCSGTNTARKRKTTPKFSSILPKNKIGNVIDAVNAIAISLDRILRKKGPRCTIDPTELLATVKKTKFIGYAGHTISFDANGDLEAGAYSIVNVHKRQGDKLTLHPVGTWNLKDRKIILNPGRHWYWPNDKKDPPSSKCTEPCTPGQYALVNPRRPCCWECIECPDGTIQNVIGGGKCKVCGSEQIANKNKTKCMNLRQSYFNLSEPIGKALAIASCIGITLSLIILVVFIKARKSPIIKSSNMKLSCIQIVCICSLYGFPFLLTWVSSSVYCIVNVVYVGSLSTISIATTLSKTERLYRIFRARHRLSRRSVRMGNRAQYVIVLILTLLQLTVSLLYFLFFPPDLNSNIDTPTLTRQWQCANHDLSCIVMTTYLLAMAVLCAFFGFRARKLPSYYNEAKGVALAMFMYCLSWILYLFMNSSVHSQPSQSLLLCFVINITNTEIIFILYLPKLWILCKKPSEIHNLYFHEQNTAVRKVAVVDYNANNVDQQVKRKWHNAMANIKVKQRIGSTKIMPLPRMAPFN